MDGNTNTNTNTNKGEDIKKVQDAINRIQENTKNYAPLLARLKSQQSQESLKLPPPPPSEETGIEDAMEQEDTLSLLQRSIYNRKE